jgi:hypothetical protein
MSEIPWTCQGPQKWGSEELQGKYCGLPCTLKLNANPQSRNCGKWVSVCGAQPKGHYNVFTTPPVINSVVPGQTPATQPPAIPPAFAARGQFGQIAQFAAGLPAGPSFSLPPPTPSSPPPVDPMSVLKAMAELNQNLVESTQSLAHVLSQLQADLTAIRSEVALCYAILQKLSPA